MARRKNQPEAVRIKYLLAERLRVIRTEMYGERGGPDLARKLGVPIRTWYNYESGVTVPSEVILRFIELTSVEPIWLLHGKGPKFRARPAEEEPSQPGTSVKSLLRKALARLESRETAVPDLGIRAPDLAVSRVPLPRGTRDESLVAAVISEYEHCEWLAAQSEGRYLRMEGDAMAPIVSDGAFVAFADTEEDARELEGKLVVAWVEGQPMVRWFERSGHYALLRAENPGFEPGMTLIDLQGPADQRRLRRILWIGTPH